MDFTPQSAKERIKTYREAAYLMYEMLVPVQL